MMFPKDRAVYANLNTSFTDFNELLNDLNGRRITGYSLVSFPGYAGVLFLQDGAVVAGLEQVDGVRNVDSRAVTAIHARAREKGGTIDVYALNPEILALIVGVLDADALYRDLASGFTSLDRLLARLSDDGHTGYVEITLENGRGAGMIFFDAGRAVECVFAMDDQAVSGTQVLAALVDAVSHDEAVFNVYRVRRAPAIAEPEAATETPPRPAQAEPVPEEQEEPGLLEFWGEVLGGVEALVDGLSKSGRFGLALKEVLVSRASTYPFLDPFAAEFDYRDGTVRFDGELPHDFSKGLADCLADAVAKLAFQLKRADLETRVREQLAGMEARHADLIEQFGLADDLQEFVA
jgi:hypothetical protein